MPLTLTLHSSTPAGLAASLLAEVYGQHVPDLVIVRGETLSLSSANGDVKTLPSIATALVGAASGQMGGTALGQTDAEKGEVESWLTRIGHGEFEGPDGRSALDSHLTSRTFLVGNTLTAADLALCASLRPYILAASHTSLLAHPALSRHFDHVQHLPLVVRSVTPVGIDVNNVPVVEIKQEVKVKKVKEEVLPAAAAAAAAVAVPAKEAAKEAQTGEGKEAAKEGGKKAKKEKAAGGADGGKKSQPPAAVVEAPAPHMIDLRVGKIIDVKLHPDADSLYVETIDVGEPEPRTVVSGLVKYIPIEQMRGRTLITVCNLKPANMRGVKSFAMVLCASSKEGKDGGIEFVDPPAGSKPGDRVYFEGFESQSPLDLLNPKRKIFETVQPGFTTLETKEAAWIAEDKTVHKIVTALGPCTVPTFIGASLS